MKTYKNKILKCSFKIALFFIVLFTNTLHAQDIHFAQFYETAIIRNPALAGLYDGDVRAVLGYKDQWNAITNAYRTGFGSVEYKLPVGMSRDFISLGGYIAYDRSGSISLQTTHAMPTINYHKSLSNNRRSFLSLGFSYGFFQRSFDAGKITTNSQYQGGQYVPSASIGENFSRTGYTKFDGSVGLSYNAQVGANADNNLYIGAAYHHFNKPNVSFFSANDISLAPKFNFNAGIKIATDDYGFINIQADHSTQDVYKETLIGALYSYNLTQDPDDKGRFIHGGLMMRLGDAIIPVVKVDMQPFTIGVSYEALINGLRAASRSVGGFEVTLSYVGWRKNGRMTDEERRISCPKF
jgi:type IX secretion system PorP/SprF family membrane protein